MAVGVEGSEVLYQTEGPVLLLDREQRAVVSAMGRFNDPHLQPFVHVTFDFFSVSIWDLELLDVDRTRIL